MHIRFVDPSRSRDLVVDITDPDATIADLAATLDPARPVGPLLVDGRLVTAATPLDRAGIGDGAVVSRPTDGRTPGPVPGGAPGAASAHDPVVGRRSGHGPEAVVTLAVTTGFDAGREWRLTPGVHRLGRANRTNRAGPAPASSSPSSPGPHDGPPDHAEHLLGLDDPTVSAAHVRLVVDVDGAVTIEDLGSTNGTWVDGRAVIGATRVRPGVEVRCGAAVLALDPTSHPNPGRGHDLSPAPGARTRPWHRPPRAGPAVRPPPLEPPPPPEPPAALTPVGVLAVVGSVAVGAVMVVVLGSWTYALFALLGPVLMVGNAIDARRRRRRSRTRGARHRRADLARLETDLTSRHRGELADRGRRYPGTYAASLVAIGSEQACWERRPGHPDAFEVRIGVGSAPWNPPVRGDPAAWADDVAAVVDRHRVLADAPIGLRLEPGVPVAVVGPAPARLALARGLLVQAVSAHGPADLQVAVLARPDRAAAWDWTAWLPHACHPEVGSLLAGHPQRAATVAAALMAGRPPDAGTAVAAARPTVGPVRVVVVDDPTALAARRSAARSVLRAALEPSPHLVPLVLVDTVAEVPAACRVVLMVDAAGSLVAPAHLAVGPAVLVGAGEEVATEVARSLARYDDPELDDPGRNLPGSVALLSLLGTDRVTPAGLEARWRASGGDPAPRAVIGMAADGPLVVDLAADGPHALVAGTTGSGKSELLRTLVASLAAGSSPDHLTFVLVDFKGGSAFDACARLPHTTGLVTDLDEHLAARALRCLEAELRHREQRLRQVGADDLADLRRRAAGGEPLPRLVVVVDEFATLAAELPDFVDALVGVAQRGRSLGVHLVLATQRPSGSVSEHIRANTALRVALRVQAAADSIDVLDVADAATIPRQRPGRALVRLGPDEIVAVQTALSTTTSSAGVDDPDRASAIHVRPLRIDTGAEIGVAGGSGTGRGRGATDLDRLVEAMAKAWSDAGGRPPRRPWPEPLPLSVPWPVPASPAGPPTGPPGPAGPAGSGTGRTSGELVVGIGDDPDHQRQIPFTWRLAHGPLLAVGLPGSGTTTLAATAVLEAARRWDADRLHVHVVDLGAGDLAALAGLPHVGAVIGADDLERQRRLVADLAADLGVRRAAGASGRGSGDGGPPNPDQPQPGRPIRIVVIDGLGAFRSRWDDLEPSGTWGHLVDVATRGAEVGIHVLLAAEGLTAAPHQVVAACRQRLVFRLGERSDHGGFGIAASSVPDLPPGRAVAAEGPMVVQVARPVDGLAAAVARVADAAVAASAAGRGPRPIGVLPARVGLADLQERNRPGPFGATWAGGPGQDRSSVTGRPAEGRADCPADGSLPLVVGVSDVDLAVARLVLPPGGHALVAGPPRSGRSTTLATLAHSALASGVAVVVVARDARHWPTAGCGEIIDPDDPGLAAIVDRRGPLLVVVDDADLTGDDHRALSGLTATRRADRHVVASGRSDRFRGMYAHWTRELRADRCGLLLVPDLDLDGELLGARLPRRPPVALGVGRGWLVGGDPEGFVQVALPDLATGPVSADERRQ